MSALKAVSVRSTLDVVLPFTCDRKNKFATRSSSNGSFNKRPSCLSLATRKFRSFPEDEDSKSAVFSSVCLNLKLFPGNSTWKSLQVDTASPESSENFDNNFQWTSSIIPFLFPAIGGLLFGYDIGATSGALVNLRDPVLSGTNWYDFSATMTGLVVSGTLIGALLGSVLAFYIADFLGRRKELILASFLYFLGLVAMATSPTLIVFLSGRVVFGLGIGLAMHAGPMYIAETAPSKIRGTLISLKEVFIVLGIVLGLSCGSAVIDSVAGWRLLSLLPLPLTLAMAAGMLYLPPSPRWLMLSLKKETDTEKKEGVREEAVRSLLRLRGPSANEEAARRVVQEMEAVGVEDDAMGDDLWKGGNLGAIVVGGGLVFFQQVTGQPSVLYYAATILQEAGFSEAKNAAQVSVAIGIFKLLMTAVAVGFVDRVGRKPLLIVGISGIILSLFSLGIFYATSGINPIFSVIALLLYVGAYQVSFGPISWLMVSEIFALRVRGRAQSLATLVNFGSNALVTFALPPVQDLLGQSGTFFSFGGIAVASLLFVILKVPETKGLSLEEIEAKLSK